MVGELDYVERVSDLAAPGSIVSNARRHGPDRLNLLPNSQSAEGVVVEELGTHERLTLLERELCLFADVIPSTADHVNLMSDDLLGLSSLEVVLGRG